MVCLNIGPFLPKDGVGLLREYLALAEQWDTPMRMVRGHTFSLIGTNHPPIAIVAFLLFLAKRKLGMTSLKFFACTGNQLLKVGSSSNPVCTHVQCQNRWTVFGVPPAIKYTCLAAHCCTQVGTCVQALGCKSSQTSETG